MKLSLLRLISVFFSLFISVSVLVIHLKLSKEKERSQITYSQKTPSIFLNDSFYLSTKPFQIDFKKKVFLLIVSINCEYCHSVLNKIHSKQNSLLGDNHIIIVYLNPFIELRDNLLLKNYQKTKGVYYYSDNDYSVRRILKYIATPSVFKLKDNKLTMLTSGSTQTINFLETLK